MAHGKDIAALIKVLQVLRDKEAEFPIQTAQTLLCVALQPGMTMQDIAKATGLSQSSASRNIQSLGKWHRLGKPGMDLVEAVEDPHDTRRKIVFLTKDGRELVGKLLGAAASSATPVAFEAPTAQDHLKPIFKARMGG
nr:MarR family winged helix-turn-helix transcriptional regulator [Methylobacterium sp. ZNC0032]